jgi:Protein of unknown function (DUF3303)
LAKEAIMKYVVAWKPRLDGSAAENEAAVARLLEVFSKWTPAAGVTFHQFVARVDGEGGFAVTEGDDLAAAAFRDVAKFTPFLEYTIYPVLDIAEAAGLLAEGAEWRKSIT